MRKDFLKNHSITLRVVSPVLKLIRVSQSKDIDYASRYGNLWIISTVWNTMDVLKVMHFIYFYRNYNKY